jgi:hypothetical protein
VRCFAHGRVDEALGALQRTLSLGGIPETKIGLYSEAARRDIRTTRTVIAERGYGQTADDIGRCRQELLTFDQGTPQRTAEAADFSP